jgi:hypothetical protein
MMMGLLVVGSAGCSPSSPSDGPKAEAQVRDEINIQELSKKGYNFSEIRLIMKGEQPKARPTKKRLITRR